MIKKIILDIAYFLVRYDETDHCILQDYATRKTQSIIVGGYDQEVNSLVESVAAKYGFWTKVHDFIRQEATHAFAIYNITEPIIILQDPRLSNEWESITNGWQTYYHDKIGKSIKILIIGWGPLTRFRITIFYLCAHLIAGDLDTEKAYYRTLKQTVPLAFTNVGISLICGIKTVQALYHFNVGLSILAGTIVTFALILSLRQILGTFHNKIINPYMARRRERRADIFAIQKLISLHDYYGLIADFINSTLLCEDQKFKHEHRQSFLKKAHRLIIEFKKANIDFHNLPIDKNIPIIWPDAYPDDADIEKLQEEFTLQVKKYFPEYL